MRAKDYSIMYCRDGNLYINNNLWTKFRSDDSKRFSEEDLESIERWIEQNNKYVRKDAFVEKACAWFRTLDDKEPPFETTEEFIEELKKAMKGE